jgi:hypothetical protein
MFPKACLAQQPGGKAKRRRNAAVLQNRLEQWQAGERATLWQNAPRYKETHPGSDSAKSDELRHKETDRKRQAAVRLATQGMPGKAVKRLTSLGFAPDTPQTEAVMRSKFPAPPPDQSNYKLPDAPPSNEISEDNLLSTIRSFARGAGPGPSGLRPDLLKQLLGLQTSADMLKIMTAFANLMANGEAPVQVAPFLAGACGHAFRKDAKTPAAGGGEQDARPVCAGEAWRRAIGKALLTTEADRLQQHLAPHQLAVKVPGGVEVLPHVARLWREDWETDGDRAMVDFDQANAHNAVDRCAFLLRAHEVVPGLARWLRWVYPLDRPTFVFYRGRVIESRSGGQQGCPLIGMCHALVQRAAMESLGLVPTEIGTTELLPVMEPPASLDVAALFADDGILAGPQLEVLRSVQHLQIVMPKVGLTFSKLEVSSAVVGGAMLDQAAFEASGISVNSSGNTLVMKSPIGDEDFTQEYARGKAAKLANVYVELAQLPSRHVAFHLGKYQSSRLNYLARTTPKDACGDAFERADSATRAFVEALTGQDVAQSHWETASLPIRHGGLGLPALALTADAAYIASRVLTTAKVRAVYPHRRDGRMADTLWDLAVQRVGSMVPLPTISIDSAMSDKNQMKQKVLVEQITEHKANKCFEKADALQRQHFLAQRAPGAGRWLHSTPRVDRPISDVYFAIAVALRVGVDLKSGCDRLCPFCGACLDLKAIHDLSCTCGGDIVARHNAIRDILFEAARRGDLKAVLERVGLLSEPGMLLDLRRPADILIEGALAGTWTGACERLALDIKVINALGAGHADPTSTDPLEVMEKYHEQACALGGTERLCRQQGIAYRPVVFTAQGGMGRHAEAIVTRISEAIAAKECADPGTIKAELVERISCELARQTAAAVCRRRSRKKMLEDDPACHEALLRASRRLGTGDSGVHEESEPEM